MWPDMYEKAPGTEFVVNFHLEGFKKLRDHWEEVRQKVAEANSPEFVTFQGYELHSREYGDHHLLSIDDDLPLIYRDSPGRAGEGLRWSYHCNSASYRLYAGLSGNRLG